MVKEWDILYTAQARKDAKKLAKSGLKTEAQRLLKILKTDPYQDPPPVKLLTGNLAGVLSRRITYQHRLAYQVFDEERQIKVISMWSHYESTR